MREKKHLVKNYTRRHFFKLGGWGALMATFTPNYNLRKPDDTDDVDVDTDLGDNLDIIDEALEKQSLALQVLVKAVDTSRNTTIVLANDPELVNFQLVGGETYELEGILVLATASNTPDFKGAVVLNGVAGIGPSTLVIDGLELGVVNVASALVSTSAYSVSVPGSYSAPFSRGLTNVVSAIKLKGIIQPLDNGTLDLQWCQNTSDVNDVTLRAGSYLKLTKFP